MSLPIYTSTTKEVSCPRCNAQPGEGCKTPKGRETRRPHVERLKAYRESIGPEEFEKRHALKGAVFGTDILKGVVCQNCNVNPAEPEHSCPYSEDVCNDPDTKCNCCRDCQYQCAMDI